MRRGGKFGTVLLTRGAYATDGFEVAGFPFTFWRAGGFSYACEFDSIALFGDLVLAFAVSALATYFFVGRGSRHRFRFRPC
jgi:hypothetical protein